ncbi:MAG: PepSY-associated TM helix domain-containing protein [Pseudomonadota bacterium]
MIALDQARTKRLTAIHGWSGTILGVLLYVVVLTGAVAVFAEEIGVWSQGGTRSANGITELIDRPLRDIARETDPRALEEISISKRTDGAIRLSLHTHAENPATGESDEFGALYYLDPQTGEPLRQWEGFSSEMRRDDGGRIALERFLIDLHVQLYVPAPWGLILTGILGLAIMVASVSGLMMHRHLIRDAFLPARGNQRLVSARDRHVLASTWSLPFGFLLAFTGAFFSFAISLGLPIVAMVAFGGDQQEMVEQVIGIEAPADKTPAPLASLDYILAESTERVGTPPVSVAIAGYGTAGATVTLFHPPDNGALLGTTLMFSGADRSFLGEKPALCTVPSAGSAVVSLMGPLHFGNFAGLTSKIAWLALGAAMSYVVISGMHMWVRRREDQAVWRRFAWAITISAWGLPLAMLGSAAAFFLTLPAGDPTFWTPMGFLIAAIAAIFVGLGPQDPSDRFRVVFAVSCLALPLLRHLTGGTAWSDALAGGQVEVISIDLLLLALGAVLLWQPNPFGRREDGEHRRSDQRGDEIVLEPAE